MTERPAWLPSQEQVIELLDDEFARAGYEIEDVVVDGNARPPRLTVIVDGDGPLDLDTLAALSRQASSRLDAVQAGEDQYVLEVTSPGIDRPLTAEKHFRRARGRKAELALRDGTNVTGRIGRSGDGTVRLVVQTRGPADFGVRELSFADILKAVVQVEFSAPSPRELELAGVGNEEAGA